MEWGSLQLKLISCRDLKAFNLFQKLSVYAVISIFNDGSVEQRQRQKTPVDGEGGRHPEWNHPMHFDIRLRDIDHLFLKFKLKCAGVIFGKRGIGEVHVPFRDLIDEFNGSIRFVSYQVRGSDGKPNGVLNFSYKLKGEDISTTDDSPSPAVAGTEDHQLPCNFSAEKVNCQLGINDVQSPAVPVPKKSLYPSLEDIHSASPADNKFYYPIPIQEYSFYNYSMPPPPFPAFVADHGCPSPFLQTTGPQWCMANAAAYGYGLRTQ